MMDQRLKYDVINVFDLLIMIHGSDLDFVTQVIGFQSKNCNLNVTGFGIVATSSLCR